MSTSSRVKVRRLPSEMPLVGRHYNRLIDQIVGNSGGRLRLWGDDGDDVSLIDGSVTTTGNYAREVMSAAGNHDRIRKSDDSLDVWRVQDAGATLVGIFGVTGNTTMTGTLSVSGLFAAAANATVGGTLGVTGAATFSSTATVTGLLAALANATVGTTLVVGGRATAGEMIVGAAAPVDSEIFRVNGTSYFDQSITFPNNVALLMKDAGGTSRGVVQVNASDEQIFGAGGFGKAVVRGLNGVQLRYFTTTVFEIDGSGRIGFNGASPVSKPTVTGSRGGNAALASVLTKLDDLGLINDSSTA